MLNSFQYDETIPKEFVQEANDIIEFITKHSPLARSTFGAAFSKGKIKVSFLPDYLFDNFARWVPYSRTIQITAFESNKLIPRFLLEICKAANPKPNAADFSMYRDYSQSVQKFERDMVQKCSTILQEIKKNTFLMKQLAKMKIGANDLAIEMPKPIIARSDASLRLVDEWIESQVRKVQTRKMQDEQLTQDRMQKQMQMQESQDRLLAQRQAQDAAYAAEQAALKAKQDMQREKQRAADMLPTRARPVLTALDQQKLQASIAQEAQSRVLAVKSKFSR